MKDLLLFSTPWMQAFGQCWFNDSEINRLLSNQNFNAVIGYGFTDNPKPNGVIVVADSRLQSAEAFTEQTLSWDLRARPETWKRWLIEGFRLERMGYVLANRELIFEVGDYRKMLHTPRLASAFLRSFELMQKVPTQFPQPLNYAA